MGSKLCKCTQGPRDCVETKTLCNIEARSRYSHYEIETDYKIDKSHVLGTGFNGPVVLGVSKHTGQLMAVKTFKKLNVEKKKLDFLRAEVNIYLQVDHPHIARLLHVYECQNSLSLVMERCTGNELYYRLQKKKVFTEREAEEAAYQMCLAIAYLHKHHIVHCDLKLENWLYETDEDTSKLKLIDFGFSKVWDETNALHQSCGSLAYVAPEVINQNYTTKCDMWSLGVIVFMLLGGYPPFHGKDSDQLISQISNCKYSFRRDKWENTSEWSRDFITKLLVFDPKCRLSAIESLQHPWLESIDREIHTCDEVSRVVSPALLDDLRRYAKGSHLKHLALSIMAHHSSSEELQEIREAFLALDKDKTGTISFDNLRTAINAQFDLSETELKEIFEVMNLAHDQEIHYSEFIAALMQTRVRMDKNMLRETFDHLDVFHAGKITKKDLQQVIGSNTFEHADINSIMCEIEGCTPKSGISFEKFSEHLQSVDFVPTPSRLRRGVVTSPRSASMASSHGSFASISSGSDTEPVDGFATPTGTGSDYKFGDLTKKQDSAPATGEKNAKINLPTQTESEEEQEECTSKFAREIQTPLPVVKSNIAITSCGIAEASRLRPASMDVNHMVTL